MKTRAKLEFAALALFLVTMQCAQAQMAVLNGTMEVKRFSDKAIGGECILKSARLSAVGNTVSKTFEFEAPESGDYYVHSWSMSHNSQKGTQTYEVFVDDDVIAAGVLRSSGRGWGSVELVNSLDGTPRRVHLSAGQHAMSFKCQAPHTPAIDFIRLAQDESNATILDTSYRKFIDLIKATPLPRDYRKLKGDSSFSSLKKTVNNPEGNYYHDLGVDFSYTYYENFYWSSGGGQVTFETKKGDPTASDPVMTFFNALDPVTNGSWSDDDGGVGLQSKLTVTIPCAGWYCLLIWSYGVGTSGTSDLYYNDSLFASDIPLTHSGLRCDHSDTDTLNYFTTHLTGDSRLWIEDQDGFPGKIRAYNDDFGCPGNFDWGDNARIRKPLSMSIRAGQLSAYSSYNPTGTADLYLKCGSFPTNMGYANLKAIDAIGSAPATSQYECWAWSGGITSSAEDPLNLGSTWNNGNGSHADTVAAFDNYYGNKNRYGDQALRYATSGQWTYTNSGATSENSLIDLWTNNVGFFVHASVNSEWDSISYEVPVDSNAHGYDWESKDGPYRRYFHPRNALGGQSGYGQVTRYYTLASGLRKKGAAHFMTSGESVKNGSSALEIVHLTRSEHAIVDSLKRALGNNVVQGFNEKYSAWKQTWSHPKIRKYSGARNYADSKEYFEFLGYCLDQDKKVLPLILERLDEGDYYVIVPLEDLTYRSNEKLMEEVHQENRAIQYDERGAFIMHGILGNWLKYGKRLLSHYSEYQGFSQPERQSKSDGVESVPLEDVFIQCYPNPFNPSTLVSYRIPAAGPVSVKIYDVLGKEVAILVDSEDKEVGMHDVKWSGQDKYGRPVSSGVYYCRLMTSSIVRTLRLILIK